jgi:PAS domain S-box-containing protein
MAKDQKVNAKNQSGNYSGRASTLSSYFNIIIPSGFLIILLFVSFYNYLLFHSLAEVISIVIAFGIFMVVWNSRKFIENNFFIIIGIAYAFVSIIDFLHATTYKGINIFPGITSNLPTQLWTAARYLQSFSLIAAALIMGKKIKIYPVIAIYTFILSLILFSIFSWHVFPNCFIEGSGLTPFKKASEYIISFLIFCSILILYKKKNNFDQHLFYLVISSNIVNIVSELNFTLYQTPYSNTNLIGHILKIVSFYLMYKAIIVSGLKDPINVLFRTLKQKDEALHLTRFSIDHSENLLFWIKPDGKIYDFNDTVIRKLGYSEDELNCMSFTDICHSPALEIFIDIKGKISQCKSFEIEHAMITKDRRILEMEMGFNYLKFEGKEYYCTFVKDITEKKRIE